MIGRATANNVLEAFGTDDPVQIAYHVGLEIISRKFIGTRCDDNFLWPLIFIPDSATTTLERTLVAHCLGHFFMDSTNQIGLHGVKNQLANDPEIQADEFAAHLLLPDPIVLAGLNFTNPDIALAWEVSLELVEIRMAMIGNTPRRPRNLFF